MITIMTRDAIAEIFAHSPVRLVARGARVFCRGDPVESATWLESGAVGLTRAALSGGSLMLHRAHGPCWLAEASVFSETYHCDAEAITDVSIRSISKVAMLSAFSGPDPELALMLAQRLARELRDARARAERLTLKTVAQRLDAWEDAFGPKPAGLSWARVAEEIGVSPEALYRERARRRARISTSD